MDVGKHTLSQSFVGKVQCVHALILTLIMILSKIMKNCVRSISIPIYFFFNFDFMASSMTFVDYHFKLAVLRFSLPGSWRQNGLGEICLLWKYCRLKANIKSKGR